MSNRIKEELVEKGPLLALGGAVAGALVAHLGSVTLGLGLLGVSAVLTTLAVASKMALVRLAADFLGLGLQTIAVRRALRIGPELPRLIIEPAEAEVVDTREEAENADSF